MEATKENAAKVAEALKTFVDVVLVATAYARTQREKCDFIQRRVLSEGVYSYANKYRAERFGRITDPRFAWMMPDFDFANYWSRVDAEYRRAGMKIERPGECPALVGETLQIDAENALIGAAATFLPNMTNDRLLCGREGEDGLSLRRRWLDLLIGLVVNVPGGYVSPLKRTAAEPIPPPPADFQPKPTHKI